MAASDLFALLPALGVALALQIPYLLFRRRFPRQLDRLRFQLWTLAVAAVTFLFLSAESPRGERALALALFVAVVATVDLVYRVFERLWLGAPHGPQKRAVVPKLVRDLGGWLILAAAILLAGARIFDWELGKWALPSAVLSAVIGFALQDVLKNVFAGISLQTEAPFGLGDWIVVDGEPRQVLEMSWRSTHMRNNLGVNFREPNANLGNARITNLGSGDVPMGFEIEVALAYGAPPGRVKASLESAARACPAVVDNPPPQGLLATFGDSGVVYRLRFWSRQVGSISRLHDQVRSRVWYQLQRDGWTIPFPIRTVEHVAQSDLAAERRESATARAAALLARIDLFAALPVEARRRLAEAARPVEYDAGERLVAEGERGDSLFLVANGTVLVSKSGSTVGTSAVALATLEEGDYFGEMSLLTGEPRSASVVADSAVEVFVLDRAALAPILDEDPALAETLSRVLADRAAATASRFADRREARRAPEPVEAESLLHRIRTFFKLG
jgi:small-conductance mechanosensitive channel